MIGELIPVMLCVNDYRNGQFAGRVSDICVFGGQVVFSLVDGDHACRIDSSRVQIGRLVLPHRGHREWVGNWCWDEVRLSHESVVRLMNWVRDKSTFRLECAAEPLWDWWHNSHEPLTMDMLCEVLA